MSKEKNEVKWEIAPDAKYGDYANFVKIQHSLMDFRFDFAKTISDVDENIVYIHSRLFMSPLHAKLFFNALADNISKYESQFGPINLKQDKHGDTTMPSFERH